MFSTKGHKVEIKVSYLGALGRDALRGSFRLLVAQSFLLAVGGSHSVHLEAACSPWLVALSIFEARKGG